MNTDVFISHHTDSSLHIVEAIVNKLEANGLRCWYAPRDTHGIYANSIAQAINSCSIFLLILNKPASESVHVLNELDMVTKRLSKKENVCIIPFHIADDDISADAQYYLGRIHWIEAITPPIEERINELTVRITTLLNKSPVNDFTIARQHKLKSTPFIKNLDIIGREEEVSTIHQLLIDNRIVFVSGIGGTGKTELINFYVSLHYNEYDTIIIAKYESSLTDIIISEKYFNVSDISRNSIESNYEFAIRKLEKIKSFTNEKTLIVIDNFETTEDDLLEEIIHGPYRIIFTSRTNFEYLGLPMITLSELKHNKQVELFCKHYKLPFGKEQLYLLDELLDIIQGHTLTIELIARLMTAKHMKLNAMLEQIKKAGISPTLTGKVHHKTSKAQTVYSHIETLFDLASLSDEEFSVMCNLSLMPLAGVSFEHFMEWCQYNNGVIITNLIERSWIKYDNETDVISLHPVIANIVRNKIENYTQTCKIMLDNLTKKFRRSWDLNHRSRIEYLEIAKTLFFITREKENSFLWYQGLHCIFIHNNMNDASIETIKCMKKSTNNTITIETAWFEYHVAAFCFYRFYYDEAVEHMQKSIDILNELFPVSYDLYFIKKRLSQIYLSIYEKLSPDTKYLDISLQLLNESKEVFEKLDSSEITQYSSIYFLNGKDIEKEHISQTAGLYYSYALNSFYREDYENALENSQKSYNLFSSIYGEVNSDTQTPLQLLARTYSKTGKFNEAITILKKLISDREHLWKKNHIRFCSYTEILADVYLENNKIEEGIAQLQYILKCLENKKEFYTNYIKHIERKIQKYKKTKEVL